MTTQISSIELNRELANLAYEMGLKFQRHEKSLKRSNKEIKRLRFRFYERSQRGDRYDSLPWTYNLIKFFKQSPVKIESGMTWIRRTLS